MLKKVISLLISMMIVFTAAFTALPAKVLAVADGIGYYNIINTGGGKLIIRDSANSESNKIGVIPNGETVNVTQVLGNWGLITYNDVTGWILLDYAVKSSTPAPTDFFSIYTKLNELRAKFPNGKYWNWMGKSKKDVDSCTNTPCPSTGSSHKDTSHCNGQCDGFARKLGLDLFGLSTYSWQSTSYDINTICVGDIIRYNSNHTIMVVGFTSDANTLIIADCNWDCNCNIRWDASFSTSKYLRTVNWVLHYPGNILNRANYLANKPADVLNGKTTTIVTKAKPTTTTTTAKPSVTLSYNEYSLCVGEKFTLSASAKPAGSVITWKSDNSNIASVDANGKVTAKAPGVATITASTENASDSCTLKITGSAYSTRIFGNGRIDTAIEISREGWKKSDNALIAYGMNYADALAAVPLASALDCPILLTENLASGLEANVQSELLRLDVKKIYLIGGEYVVSKKIENALKPTFGSSNVIRVAGQSRYGTSIAIAEKLFEIRKQKGLGNFTNAYFCSAGGFADALAISPVAGIELNPVLYAPAKGSSLSQASTEMYSYVKTLKSRGLRNTTIIGGIYAVSVEAANDLRVITGTASERVDAGITGGRYDTMLNVFKKYYSYFSDSKTVCVATGKNFPDALAGAVFAAKNHSPVLLTGYDVYSQQSENVRAFLGEKSVYQGYIFGGVNAVPDWQYDLLFINPPPYTSYVGEWISYFPDGYPFVVPYLKFDTEDAREFNDEMYEIVRLFNDGEITDGVGASNYHIYLNGNILSLTYNHFVDGGFASEYRTCNFDVATGKRVSNAAVLAQAGYTPASFTSRAKNLITNSYYCRDFFNSYGNQNQAEAKKLRDATLSTLNSDVMLFLADNNEVMFLPNMYYYLSEGPIYYDGEWEFDQDEWLYIVMSLKTGNVIEELMA